MAHYWIFSPSFLYIITLFTSIVSIRTDIPSKVQNFLFENTLILVRIKIHIKFFLSKNIEYIMATNLCQFSIISFDICRFKHLSSIVNAQQGVGINCFAPDLTTCPIKTNKGIKRIFYFWLFWRSSVSETITVVEIRWVTVRSSVRLIPIS